MPSLQGLLRPFFYQTSAELPSWFDRWFQENVNLLHLRERRKMLEGVGVVEVVIGVVVAAVLGYFIFSFFGSSGSKPKPQNQQKDKEKTKKADSKEKKEQKRGKCFLFH